MSQSFVDAEQCIQRLRDLQATELIISYEHQRDPFVHMLQTTLPNVTISYHPLVSDEETYITKLLAVASTKGFGAAVGGGRKASFALLLSYVEAMQKHPPLFFSLSHVQPVGYMHIDHMTLKNLEIFAASYDNNKQHSLYGRINCTQTALGARELTSRLIAPLMQKELLEARFDRIAYFMEHQNERTALHRLLVDTPDIARIYAQVRTKKHPLSLLATLRGVFKKFLGEEAVVCKQELLRAGMTNATLNTLVALAVHLEETLIE